MALRGACSALLALVVAVVVGSCGYFQESPALLWYRFTTSAKALYSIVNMPQEDVDGFLASYVIFDQEKIRPGTDDAKHIIAYYKVINHLCALGEVEKMYIPPVMDQNKGIFANQMIWEEKGMADKLDVGPGKTVLDVGCGRGRVAHHVASYTGAKVIGINIDQSQVDMGKAYAEKTGLLGKQLDFVRHNYNDLPFPFKEATFDALYHVQALTYAEDLNKLFAEMFRVLKPGAKISFLDWFELPAYNHSDPKQRELLREVKALIGAVYTPKPEEYSVALKKAGFEVLFEGEASVDGGHQFPLVLKAEWFFETFKATVAFLADYHIIPRHIKTLLYRLTEGGRSFIEVDRLGLFTTSWQIIARKPAKVAKA